jgi:hypothetical protein
MDRINARLRAKQHELVAQAPAEEPPEKGDLREPIFILADSKNIFGRTLFEGDKPVPSSSSLDAEMKCWWDVVACATIRRALAKGHKRKCACYIGASNGDQKVFYDTFVTAMAKADFPQDCLRRVLATPTAVDLQVIRNEAVLIVLSGGDPLGGWKVMADNGVADALRDAYQSGAIIQGISAGAMILGSHVFRLTPEQGAADEVVPTLGFLGNVMFSAHEEADDWVNARQAVSVLIDSLGIDRAPCTLGLPFESLLTVHPDGSIEAVGKDLPMLSPTPMIEQKRPGAIQDGAVQRTPPGRYQIVTREVGIGVDAGDENGGRAGGGGVGSAGPASGRACLFRAKPWLPQVPELVSRRVRILRRRLQADGRYAEAYAAAAKAAAAAAAAAALLLVLVLVWSN